MFDFASSMRRSSLFLSLAFLVAAVTGCDSKKEGAGTGTQPAGKAVVIGQTSSSKKVLMVAGASDLKFALPEFQKEFEQTHPEYEVRLTFAASGTLYTQIKEKAPFDIFLSADKELPHKLIEEKLAISKEEFVYARGTLVLWYPKDNASLYVEKDGLGILTHDDIKKISIANPKFAPYGRAAEAALKSAKVYEKVEKKLLLAENVSQAAVFAEKGGADAGLLAQSHVISTDLKDKGKIWKVPQELYPPLMQAGVILPHCEDVAVAEQFRDMLLSDKGREILKKNGLTPPEK